MVCGGICVAGVFVWYVYGVRGCMDVQVCMFVWYVCCVYDGYVGWRWGCVWCICMVCVSGMYVWWLWLWVCLCPH